LSKGFQSVIKQFLEQRFSIRFTCVHYCPSKYIPRLTGTHLLRLKFKKKYGIKAIMVFKCVLLTMHLSIMVPLEKVHICFQSARVNSDYLFE